MNNPDTSAFFVDDHYDRNHAGDGHSRYGRYLWSLAQRFHDEDTGAPVTDRVVFAARAFLIASSPIMTPGYVRRHPRILRVASCVDEEGRIAFDAQLAAPLPAPIAPAIRAQGWAGWHSERSFFGGHSWLEPFDTDRPAAWTVLTIRVPLVSATLPAPAYQDGVPVVSVAQEAAESVCALLNRHLAGILAALDGGGQA